MKIRFQTKAEAAVSKAKMDEYRRGYRNGQLNSLEQISKAAWVLKPHREGLADAKTAGVMVAVQLLAEHIQRRCEDDAAQELKTDAYSEKETKR